MATFPSFKVKAPKQSNHNRSHYYRGTFGVGPLYPVKTRFCLPGDIIDTNVEALINTQALLTPKYGSFELKVELFYAPLDLYIPNLRFSRDLYSTINGSVDFSFPVFRAPRADDSRGTLPVPSGSGGPRYAKWRVEANSLLSFFGLGPGWTPGYNEDAADLVGEGFNGIPFLMYYDLLRTYYANQQKKTFSVINVGSVNGGLPGVYSYSSVSRADLDVVYTNDLFPGINVFEAFRERLPLTGWIDGVETGRTLSGLGLRNFKPDMKTVFLNKEFLDNNSVKSKVVPSADGSFTYEQIIMAKKMRSIGWKNALAGGSFKDWIRSQYGVTPRLLDDMPTYIGSWSTDILFDDIRATATTQVGDDTQYLGDKASSGRGYAGGSSRRIVCDRPGYLMYILSIVPRVDYASFVDRYALDRKLSDLFVNELNGVALDDMLATDLANHLPPVYDSAGNVVGYPTYRSDFSDGGFAKDFAVAKQPAWMSYMSDVNRVNGQFYDNVAMRSWVNLREFTFKADLANSSACGLTGVDGFGQEVRPDEFSYGFTDTSVTAENFLVQLNFEDVVRSNVAKRLMPHL